MAPPVWARVPNVVKRTQAPVLVLHAYPAEWDNGDGDGAGGKDIAPTVATAIGLQATAWLCAVVALVVREACKQSGARSFFAFVAFVTCAGSVVQPLRVAFSQTLCCVVCRRAAAAVWVYVVVSTSVTVLFCASVLVEAM